ncbi:hypothetical protein PCARR_a1026 [Pseudoalteromonas carrageenovora IAM 12662]|uniref:Transposase n=1 Tax=Pseudoalteromonas carrageenovora IAM 12662 TaxID=1314868 RepID=A0ABR9EQG8_PSEVC|nr:hypothetical protein ATS74_18715 [Pseudoalteromonas sp. H103]MBE0382668.1 hypothetical protein [Pseudoalteromonas carrageenovora IAM 12662]GEB73152.1 hypothetical protein PCA01_38620 [Pseudoalteromonas carrageenovora]
MKELNILKNSKGEFLHLFVKIEPKATKKQLKHIFVTFITNTAQYLVIFYTKPRVDLSLRKKTLIELHPFRSKS